MYLFHRRSDRRRFLQAGAAAGSLFVPLPGAWLWAQPDEGMKLLKLPKVALVLGNGNYKQAPLRNPVNDARAIGEALKATGFAVTLKTDTGRAEMADALRAYIAELARRKCVGLFYYAGHGVQLAWRNYMLPVDAEIDNVDDVQTRALEVSSLTEGLTRAANPLNVIILDACRDNPFGATRPTAQKGLSQMDAPSNTILAYATSPGNVASDGEGANGLYTENLLREIKVPEAKIEDVFKRVRLNVRRKSNGAQIPWESTSLEEDFWFLPPRELKDRSDTEREKQFQEELALWEKTRAAAGPAPLEEFLRRYPSGPFSELAQHQLEQVLAAQGERRIRAASQEGNPYTRGSAEANTTWRVGDSYTYRHTDLLGVESPRNFVQTVREIANGEVHYGSGLVTDLLGNILRRPGGRIFSPNQLEPLEYVVGKQWSTQFRVTTPSGATGLNEMELRIVTREPITVPAGTFNAFRVEGHGVLEEESGRVEETTLTKWVAPERLRREVAMEETRAHKGRGGQGGGGGRRRGGEGRRGSGGKLRVNQSRRWELVAYKQS